MISCNLGKKVLAMVCAGLVFISNIMVSAEKNTVESGEILSGEDYILVGENSSEKLYVSPDKAEFYVENINTGFKWYSNPLIRSDDTVASNLSKMEMSCLLLVNFINRKTGSEGKFNSYTGCTKNGNFEMTRINNGFRIDMDFKSYKFSIPICIFMDSDGLRMQVLFDEMVSEDKNNYLLSVQVLPYFGAGTINEEGYLFVPDGSGGLIYFNNGKQAANGYERKVYGTDSNGDEILYVTDVENQKIKIPVFGIVKHQQSMLAIITKGDSDVTINAFTNGQMTENAVVFPSFTLQRYTTFELGGSQVNIFENSKSSLENIEILYCFDCGENVGYSDMALSYREWLIGNDLLSGNDKKRENELFLTINGGYNKLVSVLGVPISKPTSVTNAEQAKEIIGQFKENEVDKISVNYNYVLKSEYKGKYSDSYKIEKCLNTAEVSFEELFNLDGVKTYPSLGNLLVFEKFKYPWDAFSFGIKTLSGEKQKLIGRSLGTGENTDTCNYYLASAKIESVAGKIGKSMNKKNVDFASIDDLSNTLYSDYSKNISRRYNTKKNIIKAFETISSGGRRLLLDNPNVYALKYADSAVNIPSESSKQALIDKDVPFYQIVIGNSLPYVSCALNKDYTQYNFLKALEFGSLVHYEFGYDVNNNPSSGYNTDYRIWIETAIDQYKQLSEIIEKTEGTSMVAHKTVNESVSVVSYENGCQIYINYGKTPFSVNGDEQVPESSYLIVQGEM